MVDDEDGRNKSGGDGEKRGVGLESDLRPLRYDSGRKILWAVTRIWPRLLGGRCFHILFGRCRCSACDCFCISFCDVSPISNDKRFYCLLSMWLPPSFFWEHSREKALLIDTPATHSLGLPSHKANCRIHCMKRTIQLCQGPGQAALADGLHLPAKIHTLRPLRNRVLSIGSSAFAQVFQGVGHKTDQSNSKNKISSFETR